MDFLRNACFVVSLFSISTCIFGQGLFESASEESAPSNGSTTASPAVEVSGFVKGAVFGGRSDNHDPTIFGSYGQTSLKLRADKNGIGTAFAEVRLNGGEIRGSEPVTCDIREAWGLVTVKGLDIKLGRQIVVWGRADALNPTNNVTPKNELALSSENDDTRLGNELLQLKKTVGPVSLQGIWVPCYRPDVLLLTGAAIPAGVTIKDPVYPDHSFTNGNYAVRLDVTASAIDGSVSYFNGYATLPGFDYALGLSGLSLIPKAYRMHAIGGDLSTTIGSFGLRAEAAAKIPIKDYVDQPYIPNPFGHGVIGIDRSFGDVSVLIQYSGVYVHNFTKINDPALRNPLDPNERFLYGAAVAKVEMERLNRQFTGTSDEFSHSITANVQWNTMHETVHIKLSGLYNITTEEYAFAPDISYDVADAISITIGGRYLNGKKETLNYLVSDLMSQVYTELKISF